MRISVITISLNQGRFLRDTLSSIAFQSVSPHELIVVDGGSTDETPQILKAFARTIDTLVVGEDTGPANALNIGLARATGDVVLCINAGDGLLDGAIARATEHLRRLAGRYVLYGNGLAINEDGRPLRPFLSTPFTARRYVLGGGVALHPSTFYERNTLRDLGGFNEANRHSWDGELLARASLRGVPLVRVDDSFGVIRFHSGAISSAATSSPEAAARWERLFVEAMGRSSRRSDAILTRCYRIEKHVRNPDYAIARVAAALGFSPRVRWPWWGDRAPSPA